MKIQATRILVLLLFLMPDISRAQNAIEEFTGKESLSGKWYSISPEKAVDSTGEQWTGLVKFGSENKVMIYLCGGGVSVNEYTAARGSSIRGLDFNYYVDHHRSFTPALFQKGITDASEKNPFRNWTIVAIPYSTGDFHCGRGDFEYTGLDGQQHILYQHGYTNIQLLMKLLRPALGTPEALLIAGSSAGGFGVGVMADYFAGLFPKTDNITAFVDAGIAIYDWKKVVTKVWKAPKKIADRVKTDDITLDCLLALHKDRPKVKILVGTSTRDMILGLYQDYLIDNKVIPATAGTGDRFFDAVKNEVAVLQKEVPECGFFIWNDIVLNQEFNLTAHTIAGTDEFFNDRSSNGCFSNWLENAVNGKIESFGLDLLK